MKKYSKKIVFFVLVVMISITMIVPVIASGEISVYLDNEKIQFDVAPLLVNGRTMVPMRAIFEKLGAIVYWDNTTRTAIAQKGNTNVSIAIDDTTLYKNGDPIILDVPARLNGGRTLVPLRAVSEAFECDVQWNGDTQTVNIYSKDKYIPSTIELSNAVIGVHSGTLADSYISMDYGETNAVIKKYDDYNALFNALNQGVIDCVVSDKEISNAMVEKNDNFVILDKEYVIEEYTIYTSKENKQLTEQLNTAIRKLKDNGTLKQIINDGLNGKYSYVSKGNNYSNGVLTVATCPDFPPFEFEENGKFKGIDIDVITAIADVLGYKLEIKSMDFDELLNSLSSGKVNAVISGMTVIEERLEFFDCTTPYMANSQTIVVNKNANISSEGEESIYIEPPKNIRVVRQQNGSAHIQWDKVEGAEYYHFYYQEAGEENFWFTEDDNGEKIKFEYCNDYTVSYNGLENGKRYNVIVTAVKNGVESKDSEILTFVFNSLSASQQNAFNQLKSFIVTNSNDSVNGKPMYRERYESGNALKQYSLDYDAEGDWITLKVIYRGNYTSYTYVGLTPDETSFYSMISYYSNSNQTNTSDFTGTFYITPQNYDINSKISFIKNEGDTSNTETYKVIALMNSLEALDFADYIFKTYLSNKNVSLVDFGFNVPTSGYTPVEFGNLIKEDANNYQGGGGYSTNTKITLSSFPLYLYADDGTGTFLGEINSNKYDTDSIANEYGNYGSKYQTKSIFNQYGNYGSKYSQYSVFNEYATKPPKILDKNGKVVGYLTANQYIKDAISYEEIMVLLKKFNK